MLAACATAPDYGPATDARDFGYRDQAIENNRFRVSYQDKSVAEAADRALRRAAELTQMNGYDYFTVVSRTTDNIRRPNQGGTRVGVGGSTGGFGRSGVGVGVSLPLGGNESQMSVVNLEILMGRGERPEGRDIYDASQVLSNLNF